MGGVLNLLLVVGLILFILWILGFVTSFSLGGYIHVVLVIAIICVAIWLIMYLMGRRR